MHRRELLKKMGFTAGALLIPDVIKSNNKSNLRALNKNNDNFIFKSPVKVIVIGAGNRGNVYSNYAIQFPNEMKIVGVAEPNQIRNERFSTIHDISNDKRFSTWEDVFLKPKFADAVIISTPDDLHYEPCIAALEMGYDILLEKPIAPTIGECLHIKELSNKLNRIVAVCHVLRYAPYFIELKSLVENKAIGELISVDHFEPIEHIHMSSSYVRGNWHNSKETTPIILAKSCHDMDILRWIINKRCTSISAYGSLKWFTKENAPDGSTNRCTDGCKVEEKCPYSALKIYYRNRGYSGVFDLPENADDHAKFILNELKTSDYGRCVYRMENDQPDHYVTSMLFEDNVTVNFSMEAFTSYYGRRTRIMGSMGDIVGDMETLTYTDFRTGESFHKEVDKSTSEMYGSHGGGDLLLVKDWLRAVHKKDVSLISSDINVSVDSHIMCFKAEESRLSKRMIQIQ
jgi:hypothetical protein